MTPKAMTDMQAVELIQDHMKQIEPFRVVFAFKRMRMKHIRKSTVDTMRACIALHDYRIPITTRWVGTIRGIEKVKDQYGLSPQLHGLGDKKCLLLKRRDISIMGHPNEWTIDPIFLANYK